MTNKKNLYDRELTSEANRRLDREAEKIVKCAEAKAKIFISTIESRRKSIMK